MKKEIEKWVQEIEEMEMEIQNRKEAIAAIQRLCDHEFEEIASGSHYKYYTCVHCGSTEKE